MKGFALNKPALFDAMQANGITTLRELARRSGVAESTLYCAVSGAHDRVYLKTVQKLAKALGIPTAELIKI